MLLLWTFIAFIAGQTYIKALEGRWENQLGSVVSFVVSTEPDNINWFDLSGWYINAAGEFKGAYKARGRGGFNLPLIFAWSVVWYTPSSVSQGVTSWNGYLDLDDSHGNLTFLANWILTFESGGVWNNTLTGQDKFVKID